VRYRGASRAAKSWILLVIAVVAISLLQHYGRNVNLVFIGDIAILAAAYLVWLRVAAP
jgi:hypothetical protein